MRVFNVHECGGFFVCTTCQVEGENNDRNLSPAKEGEEERLDRANSPPTPDSRLACHRLKCKQMGPSVFCIKKITKESLNRQLPV